jgi:hypothetical protein
VVLGLGPNPQTPNPKSPIPNPQSPLILIITSISLNKLYIIKYLIKINIK